ncbi:MAG: 4Fe-4S dicluster domain-containing protein [bacterium]|nr:4Fe-4S dicluster domain-containing protein [bacterium]
MKIEIKNEEVRSEIIQRIEEISGENIYKCYQCGKCSAGCPSADEMDLLPNQVIRNLQIGKVDAVLNSRSIWVCATCYMCWIRCPRGVNLTSLFEACRLMTLRQNLDQVGLKEAIKESEEMDIPQIAIISLLRKLTS